MTGNPEIYTKMAINAKEKNKNLFYQSLDIKFIDHETLSMSKFRDIKQKGIQT